MVYLKKEPHSGLEKIVKCFWMMDSDGDNSISREKIIPDGYPEMIFHYGDPYKSQINKIWETQSNYLIAGQIKNYFFLENTGVSKIFSIKFQPWALKLFFNIDMNFLTNKVVSLDEVLLNDLDSIIKIAISNKTFEDKVIQIEKWFSYYFNIKKIKTSNGELATRLIINKKGAINISDVLQKVDISERSLERYFKNHIGLSPKFYSRIIRFSNIFNFVQKSSFNWLDVAYLAGFYDQAHFIKNFKEFTGEEPSKYGFEEKNMANFFLKK